MHRIAAVHEDDTVKFGDIIVQCTIRDLLDVKAKVVVQNMACQDSWQAPLM